MTRERSQGPIFGRTGTRRSFLAATGVAGAAAFLAACGSDAKSGSTATTTATGRGSGLVKGGELNVYTWPDYFSKQNLAAYRKATGTDLRISTYSDNDTLFAKLNAA